MFLLLHYLLTYLLVLYFSSLSIYIHYMCDQVLNIKIPLSENTSLQLLFCFFTFF